MKIGLVCVAQAHVPDMISLELITYDEHGIVTSRQQYVIPGKQWRIQGQIITSLVNIPGLTPAYELTGLQSSELKGNQINKSVDLTNGYQTSWQQNYYQTVKKSRLASPLLKALDSNSGFWLVSKGMHVYGLYLSQNGFSIQPAPSSAINSCSLGQSALPAP
jgi:hypothetical protein